MLIFTLVNEQHWTWPGGGALAEAPDAPDWMGDVQREIHAAFRTSGSYGGRWRAAVRLLASATRLAEVGQGREGSSFYADQLAEVRVDALTLANLHSVRIEPPDTSSPHTPDDVLTASLRAIQFLESRRPDAGLSSYLTTCLQSVVNTVHSIASAENLNISEPSDRYLDELVARLADSSDRTTHPSFSPVLDGFQHEMSTSACSFARAAKLWGAPGWGGRTSIAKYVHDIAPSLSKFVAECATDGLDGYVVDVRPVGFYSSPQQLGDEIGVLLRELARCDPQGSTQDLFVREQSGWQFSFEGVRLFVTTFSDVYSTDHPRRAEASYLMLQPESSFSDHKIGSDHAASKEIKETIRDRFRARGLRYPEELIDSRLEARLYVIDEDVDRYVEWWSPRRNQPTLF